MVDIEEYLRRSAAVIEAAAMDQQLHAAVTAAVASCVASLRSGAPILVCGNGGSAADAMHIAAELVGRFRHERQAFNVIALGANPAVLTAWANDYDYDSVFARQVEAHGRPGGVLIALSTSGASRNVVLAAEAAKQAGMVVIALTGEGGGDLGALADVKLMAPTRDTPMVQQVHLCLYHMLCQQIEADLLDGPLLSEDLKLAARRIPHAARDLSIPRTLADLTTALAMPKYRNDQIISHDQLGTWSVSGPGRILAWVADLQADYAKPCLGRTRLSELNTMMQQRGYIIEDALCDADHVTMLVSYKRAIHNEVSPTSIFFTKFGRVKLHFTRSDDIMRLKSILSADFYERYMLKDIASRYNGGIIVDVGANVGNHTVFFGLLARSQAGAVIAIEPGQDAFALLTENVVTNGLSETVKCLNVAAGDKHGTVSLAAGSATNNGAMRVVAEGDNVLETVAVEPLADLLDGADPIAIIKIDVEGYEIAVLRGLQGTLQKHQPLIYIEAKNDSEKKAIDDCIGSLGYKSVAVFNDTPTYLYKAI